MLAIEILALQLAQRRLERDREIARRAGCPVLLKIEAYLPQCRKDAAVTVKFNPDFYAL